MTLRTKIALGGTIAALLAGGTYGGLVWWPQHQARAAKTAADRLFAQLRPRVVNLDTGQPTYQSGSVRYAPVTFRLPVAAAAQPPVPVTVPTLTVAPDGAATAEQPRLAIPGPEGTLTLGLESLTINAFHVTDGVPTEIRGTLHGPSLAGPQIDKLKQQRGALDLLLANAPAPVQAIPDQVLASVGQLTATLDLRYDPAREHVAYRGSYDLPGLAALTLEASANAVSLAAMQSANLLNDPALKAKENPAFADMSKGAVLSYLMNQGEMESLSVRLTDQGLLGQALKVYAAFLKVPEEEARARALEYLENYPVESLIRDEEPTPAALQVLNDARGALMTLARGEASALVVEARPRDLAALAEMNRAAASFNQMATTLDIDISARK